MNFNILITIFVLLLFFPLNSYSQYKEMLFNGGFEYCLALPDSQNQMLLCPSYEINFFEYLNYPFNTPDFYSQNSSFNGPCNLKKINIPPNYNNEEINNLITNVIVNKYPKIQPHSGNNYAGIGSGEYFRVKLIDTIFPKTHVKLSLWFCPRDSFTNIGTAFYLKSTTSGELYQIGGLRIKTENPDKIHTPCNWYYYETDWVEVGNSKYDILQIGGGSGIAGDITMPRYVYYDDISLLYSDKVDCCGDYKIFEKTEKLPDYTHVKDYIKTQNNVKVKSGQSIVFKAGNYIELKDFFQEANSFFKAEIEDCNFWNYSSDNPIEVVYVPNIITINDDGLNDKLCINVNNATFYVVRIINRWGDDILTDFGAINENYACIWDGKNNNGSLVSAGEYWVKIDFFNCNNILKYPPFIVTVINGNVYKSADINNLLEGNNNVDFMDIFPDSIVQIFPIPFNDYLVCSLEKYQNCELAIVDCKGDLILNEKFIGGKKYINTINWPSGIYFVILKNQNQIINVKKITK